MATKKAKERKKSRYKPTGRPNGRPTKLDADCVKKIYTFLQMGLTVTETCAMAEVSREAFYNRKEADEEFRDKVEYYSQHTVSLAKRAVYRELNSDNCDPKFALDYLKRKCKAEFGDDVTVHHDGDTAILPFAGVEAISDEYRSRLGLASGSTGDGDERDS